jgi:hypothetical protein
MKTSEPIFRYSDQASILFTKIFGIVAFSTLSFQIMRSGDKSETWDKLIFFIALVTGFASFVVVYLLKTKKFVFGLFTFTSSIIGIVLGVGGIEKHDPINGVILSNRLWLGFGPFVLGLLFVSTLIIWKLWEWNSLNTGWRSLFFVVSFASITLSTLSFYQDSKTIIDPDHSEYVLNEVMAVQAGNWPFENFIPQYQTIYTFIAAYFNFSSSDEVAQTILLAMSIATFIVVLLGVLLVRQTLPSKAVIPAVLLVVPLTAVTPFPTREGFMGSIASLLSGLPIRILPGVMLFSLAFWVITSPRFSGLRARIAFLILGVVSGWTTWSSQDFGIAAAVTTSVVIFILPASAKISKANSIFFYMVGFIPGFLTYHFVSSIMGHSINYNYFAFFARQFGSGFGAENIRTPGPVLIILPLIIALTVVHLFLLRNARLVQGQIADRLYSNSVLGLLFAVWSVLGFTYYLNRSYASGQLQLLFLPISISLGTLIGSVLYLRQVEGHLLLETTPRSLISQKSRHLTVLTLIVSLPFSSIFLLPNPSVELNRIVQGKESPRWPKPSVKLSIKDAKVGLEFAKLNNKTIAFFGASSNYVSNSTGIKSAAILNSPYDLYMSSETVKVACQYLEQLKPDYLILSDEGASLFQFENQTLCGTYAFFEISGVRSDRAAKRN